MAPSKRPSNREEALSQLKGKIAKSQAIVGAGAGIGLSATSIEAGGGDLIILYNSGHYRMSGLGSLAGLMPYSNANDVLLNLATSVLPIVKHTPLIAGVCASDPTRDMGKFLVELKEMGFCGVQNFPTVGLIDAGSSFRQGLEETGMGYDCEVRMVRKAKELGLLTTPYVFDKDEARRMVGAGADVVVAHMGLTMSASGGDGTGAKSGKSLEDCVKVIGEIVEVVRKMNEEVIVLCHGGPIATPKDAEFVLSKCKGVHGFFGASSIERLPVEEAIANKTKEFKALKTS